MELVNLKTKALKVIDASLGLVLCRLISRWRHHSGCPELADTPAPNTLKRILFIRPGGMGDMIVLLPVLQQARTLWPDAQVDVICERRNLEVLELAALGVTAYAYDSAPWTLIHALRQHPYDLAIDCEQFHHFSAIMAVLSGAPVRVGFKLNPARLDLYTHLVSYDIDGYELAQFRKLLTRLGATPDATGLHGILSQHTTPASHSRPPSGTSGPQTDRPLIAIAPGSTNRYKQWSFEKTSTLISQLVDRFDIVLLGGEDLHKMPPELTSACARPEVSSLMGKTSLQETAAVLSSAAVFLGCDSGLAHLAVALGKPTVTLFGPSDPRKWQHRGPEHCALSMALPCSPCSVFGYQKLCRDIPCMKLLTVETVRDALLTRLEPGTRP